jgi:ribosomal protein S2
MKKFVFTNKGSDEVIGMTETQEELQEAIEFFAEIKKLPIDEFLKLYDVKQIKTKERGRIR